MDGCCCCGWWWWIWWWWCHCWWWRRMCVLVFVIHIKWKIFFMCWRMAFVSSSFSSCVGQANCLPLLRLLANFTVIQQMYLQAAAPCLFVHMTSKVYTHFAKLRAPSFSARDSRTAAPPHHWTTEPLSNFPSLTYATEALNSSSRRFVWLLLLGKFESTTRTGLKSLKQLQRVIGPYLIRKTHSCLDDEMC